jgi:hypothetical protein
VFSLNGNNHRSNSNSNIGLRAACLSHLNRTAKAEPIIKGDKGDASRLTKAQSKILIIHDVVDENPRRLLVKYQDATRGYFFRKDFEYGG